MHYSSINPNIKDIIKYSTNNYIDSKTNSNKLFSYPISNPNNFFIIPLVSFISFLAGYNFHKLTN